MSSRSGSSETLIFWLEKISVPPSGMASRALIARFSTATSNWVGSAITAIIASSVVGTARNDAERKFHETAAQTAVGVKGEIRQYFTNLEDVGALVRMQPRIDAPRLAIEHAADHREHIAAVTELHAFDVVYYRFFGDVLSAPAILAVRQTGHVWSSIRSLLSPILFWIVVDH